MKHSQNDPRRTLRSRSYGTFYEEAWAEKSEQMGRISASKWYKKAPFPEPSLFILGFDQTTGTTHP